LSWRKVVGGIQCYTTACDAQAFCQGFYNIAEAGEKLKRSLEFRFDRGVRFYPFDLRPGFRLGVDCAGRRGGGCGGTRVAGVGGGRGRGVRYLSKVCQAKNINGAKLYAASRVRQSSEESMRRDVARRR